MKACCIQGAVFAVAYFAVPAVSQAALVQTTFNDNSTGSLNGQGGGTGFTGNWSGTGTISVGSGDLDAQPGVFYALNQSGTPQSVRGDFDGARANSRSLATALTNDTIWFSFLVNQAGSESRGGIDLNPTVGSTGPTGFRIVGVGSALRIIGGGDLNVANQFTFGTTSAVIGRIDVDATGNDETLTIWVDPTTGSPGPDAVITDRNFIGAGGLTALGIESYISGGTSGGTVDLITFSDNADGRADVGFVGVPEPSTLALGLFGLLSLAMIRQRQRKRA